MPPVPMRFEIFANTFRLAAHSSEYEKSGLEWCKRYMARFQREVANIPLKVVISEKEYQKNRWEYRQKPYFYKKTLHKKPIQKKKSDAGDNGGEATQPPSSDEG